MSEKVLLIDTEKNVLLTYQTFLEEEGYQVDIATNEEEALNKLASQDFAVIITESYLKNKSTLDLVKKVKHLHPEIYLIMVSALLLKQDAYEDIIHAGVDDFFTKPFSTRNLLVNIKKGLRRRALVLRNVQLEEKLKGVEQLLATDPCYSSRGRIICNSLYFHKKLQEEMVRAERYKSHFSLIVCDIDPSDNGHKQLQPDKDRISSEISRILLKRTRQTDIITQYNGNFALILLETPHQGAKILTERLREEITTTLTRGETTSNFTEGHHLKFDSISYPEHSALILKWINESDRKRSN